MALHHDDSGDVLYKKSWHKPPDINNPNKVSTSCTSEQDKKQTPFFSSELTLKIIKRRHGWYLSVRRMPRGGQRWRGVGPEEPHRCLGAGSYGAVTLALSISLSKTQRHFFSKFINEINMQNTE